MYKVNQEKSHRKFKIFEFKKGQEIIWSTTSLFKKTKFVDKTRKEAVFGLYEEDYFDCWKLEFLLKTLSIKKKPNNFKHSESRAPRLFSS